MPVQELQCAIRQLSRLAGTRVVLNCDYSEVSVTWDIRWTWDKGRSLGITSGEPMLSPKGRSVGLVSNGIINIIAANFREEAEF